MTPFAFYDPESSSWKTSQPFLGEEWGEWSETWPKSGMTAGGRAFELPMSVLRTAANASSLLPTPRTTDSNGAGSHGSGGPDLRTVASLLPTPRATDGTKGGPNQRGSSGDLMLPSAIMLLPTPTSRDHKGANQRGDTTCLTGALLPTPAAHDSGNTPENHLRKKPGRTQVTSLQVIVDYGLIPSGGRISEPSADGNISPAVPLHDQLSLDGTGSDCPPGSSSGCKDCPQVG